MASDQPTVRDIRIDWAVIHFGGIGPARAAAHQRAIKLLQEDQESSSEWAESFMRHACAEIHTGDCGLARTWDRGPATCSACVYDEFMLKAWCELQKEINADV